MSEKETVEHILNQDSLRKLLERLAQADIKDFAISYRLQDGTFYGDWLGDSLALKTMVDILSRDIEEEIDIAVCEQKIEEDDE